MTARWPRLALAALLAFTAALYLWNLSVQGYGNTFYAAPAQAGAQSWSAWFFGAVSGTNATTLCTRSQPDYLRRMTRIMSGFMFS